MSAKWHNRFRDFNRDFWQQYELRRGWGERQGQARMNALSDVAPELYELVSGTTADSFYNDLRVPAFDVLVFGYDDPTSSPTETSK